MESYEGRLLHRAMRTETDLDLGIPIGLDEIDADEYSALKIIRGERNRPKE